MLTWLCRVMIFVFTFQIFAPQIAQAGDVYTKVQQGVRSGKDALFAQKLQELEEKYQNFSFNASNPSDKDVCRLNATIKDLHLKSSRIASVLKQKFSENVHRVYAGDMDAGAAWRPQLDDISHTLKTSSAFRKRVEKGNITLDELVDALDPWRPEEVNLST